MTPFALIVPAAGTGSRSGRDLPKQYVTLAEHSVLAHTLRPFLAIPECREIIVAIDDAWRTRATECIGGMDDRVRFVTGGTERQSSITNALAALTSDVGYVLVHDAARPCVSHELIERVAAAVAIWGAVIPVVPIAETVKRVDADGVVIETLRRDELRAVQTPQAFERGILERAYRNANEQRILGTDDASLVEANGGVVRVVAGDPSNIKITHPTDFAHAERWLLQGG